RSQRLAAHPAGFLLALFLRLGSWRGRRFTLGLDLGLERSDRAFEFLPPGLQQTFEEVVVRDTELGAERQRSGAKPLDLRIGRGRLFRAVRVALWGRGRRCRLLLLRPRRFSRRLGLLFAGLRRLLV